MNTKLILMLAAILLIVAVAVWSFYPHRGNVSSEYRIYPDPVLTPGATNPDVTQATIKTTICKRGWSTKSIRPPTSYTNVLKKKQIFQYGYKDLDMRNYEEDHLIPLWLGGAPWDEKNLWPEAYDTEPGARDKDVVETYLHFQVCKGKMTLDEAQKAIVTDWVAVLRKLKSEKYVDPWQRKRSEQ